MLKGIVDKEKNNCDYHRTKHCNMKRIALFLIVALFAATEASAGLLPNAKWGIKAGLDYQTNDIKMIADQVKLDSNTGWFAGLQSEITWGMFGVRPELIFSHNNFDMEGIDGKMKLSKLDLPLLAQLKFFGILAIQAGPTFCLMTNTSGVADGIEWSIKRPTLGYAIGAEVRLWKLAVSARYNGAFKESEVYGLTTGENKISTLQLGLGFYF
jgi:hypothetical protein